MIKTSSYPLLKGKVIGDATFEELSEPSTGITVPAGTLQQGSTMKVRASAEQGTWTLLFTDGTMLRIRSVGTLSVEYVK